MEKRNRDLTGRQFGRWTVLERDMENPSREDYYVCRCECMWNLVPSPGIEPELGVQHLSQWTTKEVSKSIFFKAVLDLDEV